VVLLCGTVPVDWRDVDRPDFAFPDQDVRMNVNLNAGGIITAILALCVGFGLMTLSNNPDFHDHMGKVTIIGVILGALGGNFVWSLVFGAGRKEPHSDPGSDAAAACPMCGAAMNASGGTCLSCGEITKDPRASD
jgi:hypothetical protein